MDEPLRITGLADIPKIDPETGSVSFTLSLNRRATKQEARIIKRDNLGLASGDSLQVWADSPAEAKEFALALPEIVDGVSERAVAEQDAWMERTAELTQELLDIFGPKAAPDSQGTT